MGKPLKTLILVVLVAIGCTRPQGVDQHPAEVAATPIEPESCDCPSFDAAAAEETLAGAIEALEARLEARIEKEVASRVDAELARRLAEAEEVPAKEVLPVEEAVEPAVALPPIASNETAPFDSETVWRVTLSGQEPQIGPRFAPITLVLWSSFDGALCRQQAGVLDEVIELYGERIRLVWKSHPAPQSEADELASQAACAALRQDRFWEYVERFRVVNGEPRTASLFVKIAGLVGMDPVRFRRDMVSGACRQHLDSDRSMAAGVGVVAVPTLIVNGRKTPGVVTMELLQEMISEELTKVAAMEVDGVAPERIYDDLVADGEVQRPLGEESYAFSSAATVVGAENPVHVLTVFGDYECPYTRALYPNLDMLLAAFPKELAVEYRHFPMPYHGAARMAAEATQEAAAQGAFQRFHKGLLKIPGDFTMKQLERVTKRSKMDLPKLRIALRDGRHGNTVDAHVAEGKKAGVWSTPSIFVDGHRYLSPDRSFEALEALLKER